MIETNAESIKNNNKRKGRILLIYPPSPILKHNRDTINNCNIGCYNKHLPIDLLYLASISEQCNYETQIFVPNTLDELLAKVLSFQPDYILADITTPTFKYDMQALQKIKDLFPQIKVIVKGESFFTYNVNAIYEQTFLDYVIFNEPESTLKMLLSGYAEEEIQGLCYRENYQAVKTEKPDLINNLDDLPFPARHLINNNDYKSIFNNNPQTTIELMRGCANNCIDCLETAICGSQIRKRSFDSIVNEIKECIKQYKITQFFFETSEGGLDKEWLEYLCRKIIDAKLKISWEINLNYLIIDCELAQNLEQSGCKLCNITYNRQNNNYNANFNDLITAINILKRYNIQTNCNVIIGYPEDTKENLGHIVKSVKDLNCDFLKVRFPRPLPGTQLFNFVLLNHMTGGKLEFSNVKLPVTKTLKLSIEELIQYRNKIINSFYIKPKTIFKIIFSPYRKLYFLIVLKIIKNMIKK